MYFSTVEHHHCLNCRTELQGAYCHQCGQKGDTHRLTMKHFVQHDLIHGIWHLDKGILHTLRQILIRPGYLARDYIAGRRVGHFNLVTLLVLLATLLLFSREHADPATVNFKINGKPAVGLVVFVMAYAKWLLLIAIPIMAFASGKILKRLNYNTAERLVMSGYFFAGVLCIMIMFRLLFQIPGVVSWYTLWLEVLVIAAYLGFAFMQVMKGLYTPLRSFLVYLLVLASIIGYLFFFIASAILFYKYVLEP